MNRRAFFGRTAGALVAVAAAPLLSQPSEPDREVVDGRIVAGSYVYAGDFVDARGCRMKPGNRNKILGVALNSAAKGDVVQVQVLS